MAANEAIYCEDQSSCLPTFLINHPEFEYVKVPDDGDCFFHSIAAYYARTGESVDGIDPTDPYELRQYIITRFIELVSSNNHLRSMLSNKNSNSIVELLESGQWALGSFDVMIFTIPTILNINLNIYGVYPDGGHFIITKVAYGENARSTISLFLASNHYGLLYPIRGINRRTPAKKRANAKVIANIERQRKKNDEATAKLLAFYKKQASMQASKPINVIKSSSINNEAFARKLQQINNNEELSKQMQEKLSIGNNLSPKKALSSPKKKKPSIGSLPIEYIQNRIPEDSITVEAMKTLLIKYNIKRPNPPKKASMYAVFISAIFENIISIEEAENAKSAKSKKHGGTLKKKKYARSASRKNKQR
jgi:hypothetical protein